MDDDDELNEYTVMIEKASAPSSNVPPYGPNIRIMRQISDLRVLDFSVTVFMFGFALFFTSTIVHQRPIPNVEVRISSTRIVWSRDPTINAKVCAEQVTTDALIFFGVLIPVVANLLMNYVLPKVWKIRCVPHDTRNFLLALAQSACMSNLLTEFIKSITGRFRPNFYNMCGWQYDVVWDGITNLCTDLRGEIEGRKSFPSGHSSFAWSMMLMLSLYLLGRSRLNSKNRNDSAMRGGRKLLKLVFCFLPVFVAAWVSITRYVDDWHHSSDIIAGSIIGAVSACVAYGFNYGSVFSWDSAGLPRSN